MLRFKLFCFFAGMAVISLFRPKDGMDMITCARDGAQRRARSGVGLDELLGRRRGTNGQ